MVYKIPTFAIGDIHGELGLLDRALMWIREECFFACKIVFLGDYIDRGPNSRGVLDTLLRVSDDMGPNRVVILRGNHDDMMLQTLRYRSKEHEDCWLTHGGLETLANYREPGVKVGPFDKKALDRHMDFIASMPTYHEDAHRIYAHAGVDGRHFVDGEFDWDRQSRQGLMWQKHSNMVANWPVDGLYKMVVHGHTPTSVHKVGIQNGRLNLDTGCGRDGALTVARFDGAELTRIQHFSKTAVKDRRAA